MPHISAVQKRPSVHGNSRTHPSTQAIRRTLPNQKCLGLMVVKQSEMTATYFVSFSENSCILIVTHESLGVNWTRIKKLGERRNFLFSFNFLLHNGKHWSGCWECLGEKDGVEFIWYSIVIIKKFLIHEAQSLKCRNLFQTLHSNLSWKVYGEKWKPILYVGVTSLSQSEHYSLSCLKRVM